MFPLVKFHQYIRQHSLLQPEEKVLLAVSGGRDSVLLVHLFKLAGYTFGIAHCNFNLRQDEAQRDEDFVKALALELGVPFFVTSFDTKAYASEHQVSTQMAARTLRYTWFEQIRKEHHYDAIAVAHHQSDAVETILINLCRGTGIAGLHGILPKRDRLIRPLLFLSREEIDDIVISEGLSYVEDCSNASDHYARNKIRLNVIPQLKAINPQLEQTFEQNIQRFRETELVLKQVVTQLSAQAITVSGEDRLLALSAIKALVPQQLLLFELLKPYNFQEPVVRDILNSLDKQSGVSFFSASHRATINRETLIISPVKAPDAVQLSISADDTVRILGQQCISIHHQNHQDIEKVRTKAFTDADKLVYPLTIRYRQTGDRFMPLGMNTFKKLSDYLVDEKVPLPHKDTVPVLVNGNGDIIWIVGMRADNRYKVTSGTKKVTIFELKSIDTQ